MKPKIRHPRVSSSKRPELAALANEVGEFIKYWGFKSVQGRMWLYLYVASEPLNSITLGKLLKISPSLVTQSAQMLLKYRVILTAPKGPNGVLRYQANPSVAEAIRGVLEHRESVMMDRIANAAENAFLASKSPVEDPLKVDPKRLEQIHNWTGLFQLILAQGILELSKGDNLFSKPDEFLRSWELEV